MTRLEMTAHQNPSRRSILKTSAFVSLSSLTGLLTQPTVSEARLEAVNRPDLLPSTKDEVIIQSEKFLTTGQAKRMSDLIRALERDTGFRLRVLCQAYPNTPGLAIRDYWSLGKEDQKDDKYIVLVVDQFGGKGNVLNFNVGEGVKFALPNVFWTRLSGKYGTVSWMLVLLCFLLWMMCMYDIFALIFVKIVLSLTHHDVDSFQTDILC